jgi:DNA mismatch repair ATPase MutS
MKFILRLATVLLPLPLLLSLSTPIHASNNDEILPDAQALAQLELRAQQAGPRDQCFLYTELVHTMTEIAGKQMINGDIDQASATLKKVNHYAQLIHVSLADNTKRIKNAEMLMHRTTYRLGEYLHKASGEDQATLKATLLQLDKVHEELLAEVLKH